MTTSYNHLGESFLRTESNSAIHAGFRLLLLATLTSPILAGSVALLQTKSGFILLYVILLPIPNKASEFDKITSWIKSLHTRRVFLLLALCIRMKKTGYMRKTIRTCQKIFLLPASQWNWLSGSDVVLPAMSFQNIWTACQILLQSI